MTTKFYLFLFICATFFNLSCTSQSELKDSRDGQVYTIQKLKDGNFWMTENLNYNLPESWCFRDDQENCQKFGRLYTWDSAKTACPDGWHLPTDEEWWEMTSLYGKAYSTFFGKSDNGVFQRDKKNNAPNAGKEALKNLQVGGASGLELALGGYRLEDGTFYTDNNIGGYWTSSEYKSSGTGWYYGIREGGDIRRNYARSKALAFSCRCVKDLD